MPWLQEAFNGAAALLPHPGFTAFELWTLFALQLSAFVLLASVAWKFRVKDANERQGQLPEKKRGHRVATLTMSAAVLLMFILMNNRLLAFSPEGAVKWACYATGLCLVVFGAGWHIWSKVSIGRFWSDQVELQKEHRVVSGGAYALARHPMYGSLILWCAGLGLAAFNLGALLVTALVFVPMLIFRARAEEAMLEGPEYEIYRNNTRMFLPSLAGPAAFAVKLAVLALLVYCISAGIDSGSLPFLLTLHLLLGFSLRPEKVAFSYRSKSGMLLLAWAGSAAWPPFYYFNWLIAAMFAYGLFFNCPCMLVYEKYSRCPCFDALGRACGLKPGG